MVVVSVTIRISSYFPTDHSPCQCWCPIAFTPSVQPEIEQPPPEMVLLCQHLDDTPITAKHIQEKTSKDPLLFTVEQFILQGWPDSISAQPTLRPFFERKLELSVYQGCILWGSRVVIPEDYREHVLQQLHEGHPGVTRMKSLTRMYVWWPGMAGDFYRHRIDCSPVSTVSTTTVYTTRCSSTAMDMAYQTLGQTTSWLCRSIWRQDDFSDNWCSF